MNFENLESLLAIVDEGSFRKAAEKLNKAQPAVSYAIKTLEDELALTLFDRTHYKPELTKAGQILHQKAKIILDQKNDFLRLAKFLSEGGDFQVRLSITALFPLQLISERLKSFTENNPHTDLKINVDVLSTMLRLEKDEVDIGITELVQWPFDKYDVFELCKVRMIPVIATKHPLLQLNPNKIFENYDIKNIPQVVIQSTLPEAKNTNAGIVSEDLKWRVSDFKTKETMILESLGWGFMPDHMVSEQLEKNTLSVLKLNTHPAFDFPLYAIRAKNPKKWGPSLKCMWELLTQIKN